MILNGLQLPCLRHCRGYCHSRVYCGHSSDGRGVKLHQFQRLTHMGLQQSYTDTTNKSIKEPKETLNMCLSPPSLPSHTQKNVRPVCANISTLLSQEDMHCCPVHLSFSSPVHPLLAGPPPRPLPTPLRWCSLQWLCWGGRSSLIEDPASC